MRGFKDFPPSQIDVSSDPYPITNSDSNKGIRLMYMTDIKSFCREIFSTDLHENEVGARTVHDRCMHLANGVIITDEPIVSPRDEKKEREAEKTLIGNYYPSF
ncbi:hypothetical protein PV325_000936 [Microctonus aethiopoides]|uniref:Uncharacterized protein n=1 Tax=Microctonus aethiopoides TaxID=144406 RepID=A0AA39FX01_9HYME|nr:hypothetical protein PV325_000936 [Microctonus aethiopoides]KAK0092153.1 hypothetical protein PV326_002077 [Microctonus aethiopoides]KAK0177020.1 hypothetical protein PV328_001111 [Microctonus aethiopoides]